LLLEAPHSTLVWYFVAQHHGMRPQLKVSNFPSHCPQEPQSWSYHSVTATLQSYKVQ